MHTPFLTYSEIHDEYGNMEKCPGFICSPVTGRTGLLQEERSP